MSFLIARVSSGCGITHITAALWQSVFAAVRITERQRRWILHTLVEFWLAVILRAPRALRQALYETLEGSERLLDDVKEVLNLNRVYAAGCIYNAMRVAQGEVAGATGLSLPVVPAGSSPTWHLFVVRTPEREALRDTLSRLGVGSGIHYPEPPHLTRAFGYLGHRPGAFPVAEALARECLSLPIFPGMRDDEVEQVVEAVSSHFA